ncbi:hypothetical protein [Chryseobacterium sp.]|uniref:hypothetical protein n=1 Tax=Chryseobacterium sp. TaxID=1871047 RepID=UPI00321BC09A
MKQFFTVITIAMVLISFHSYTLNALRNILQKDPPPKDRGQWIAAHTQSDPPRRDRDHWLAIAKPKKNQTDPPVRDGSQWIVNFSQTDPPPKNGGQW